MRTNIHTKYGVKYNFCQLIHKGWIKKEGKIFPSLRFLFTIIARNLYSELNSEFCRTFCRTEVAWQLTIRNYIYRVSRSTGDPPRRWILHTKTKEKSLYKHISSCFRVIASFFSNKLYLRTPSQELSNMTSLHPSTSLETFYHWLH